MSEWATNLHLLKYGVLQIITKGTFEYRTYMAADPKKQIGSARRNPEFTGPGSSKPRWLAHRERDGAQKLFVNKAVGQLWVAEIPHPFSDIKTSNYGPKKKASRPTRRVKGLGDRGRVREDDQTMTRAEKYMALAK